MSSINRKTTLAERLVSKRIETISSLLAINGICDHQVQLRHLFVEVYGLAVDHLIFSVFSIDSYSKETGMGEVPIDRANFLSLSCTYGE